MSDLTHLQTPSFLTVRQFTRGVIVVASVGLAIAAAFIGWDQLGLSPTPLATVTESEPLPVNVVEVRRVEQIEQVRTYTGTIRARRQSELAFEFSGKIESINVDEGDQVHAGAVIARLDTETLLAQQEAMRASLAQAQSVLDELTAGPRIEAINAARAELDARQSQFETARLSAERRESLVGRSAIPAEEYEQAKFAAKTAEALMNSAKQQLAELEAGTRQEKIAAQSATVRQIDASLKEIDVALAKSQLLAPFDATVIRRYLDPGSIVQPTAAVVKLVEQSHLEAWIGLPVPIATGIQIGSTHQLRVGDRSFAAVAKARIQELDAATRTQTVLFELDASASQSIVSGQLCGIEISSSVATSGYWIPNSALSKGIRGLWSVMAIEPDQLGNLRVRKQDIEIIKTDTQRVLAKGTLADGDLILRDGVHRVTDGQRVQPVDDGNSPIDR